MGRAFLSTNSRWCCPRADSSETEPQLLERAELCPPEMGRALCVLRQKQSGIFCSVQRTNVQRCLSSAMLWLLPEASAPTMPAHPQQTEQRAERRWGKMLGGVSDCFAFPAFSPPRVMGTWLGVPCPPVGSRQCAEVCIHSQGSAGRSSQHQQDRQT